MVQQGTRPTVRTEEMITSGEKRRYWDPADGLWTHQLAGNASAERFYTRTKGFLLQPPGELAIYVNNELLDSKHPDMRQREIDKQKAYAGPYPVGEKKTICRCSQWFDKNCDTWDEHYGRLDLLVHHLVKDEMSDRATSMNVSGRHLSVIVPMAESMEPSELREHAHYLREKLKRDDITEDSISAKIEKGHHPTSYPPAILFFEDGFMEGLGVG